MSPFDVVLVGLIIAGCIAGFFWQEGQGIIDLWLSLDARKKQFKQKKDESTSSQEGQALDLVLETCSRYQKEKLFGLGDLRFLPDTLSLVSRIASIYYPNEKAPMEKARIGNVLAVFLEMNRKILSMLEFPGLERLTQFRLREVLPGFSANQKQSTLIPTFIMHRAQLMIMRELWIQWTLLVGEAAIKVYAEQGSDEVPEPESLLDEMDQLKDETGFSLPVEVQGIVEASRKKILFSLKPLPWSEAKSLYKLLAENIARVWHPDSPKPLHEVRIYDLLSSLAGYLEWAGQLGRKPVLNKMLGLRWSHLKGVQEVAIPFSDSKLFDWIKKYQVHRAAKWSKSIFTTLQKKQPGILFRDVALGVVKEGGKRWLILHLHDKVAEETNRLYRVP